MKIFYDGYCPLCCAEMRHLKKYDSDSDIDFIDINEAGFADRFPHLNWDDLNNRIHVERKDGKMVSGLDATYEAWRQVGKGWVYAPLRWPLIRWFADQAYVLFARHRYKISFLLTGQRRQCSKQACQLTDSDEKGHADEKR